MPFWGNRPEEEMLWVREMQNARGRAEAAAAAWSEADAAAARNVVRMAPWMRPGIALALVKGGASGDAIAAAAKSEAAIRLAQRPLRPRGALIHPEQLLPGHRRLLEGVGSDQVALPRKEVEAQGEMFGRVASESRRDFARFSQQAGTNIPTTQATAAWQEQQAAIEGLKSEGLMDDEGRLRSPVNNTMSLITKDGTIDEERLGQLTERQQGLFRRFWEVLTQVGDPEADRREIRFLDTDNEVNIFDPKYREIRLAPESIDTVDPFAPVTNAVGGALGGVGDFFGNVLRNARIPTVSQGMQGMAGGSGTGANRGKPTAGFAAQEAMAVESDIPGTLEEGIQFTGMMANAPVQEFQGLIRNAYGESTGRDVPWWESQSDFGIVAGTDLDPGDGFLVDPDSEVAQERLRREEEHGGLIHGQRVTLGRLAAAGVAEVTPMDPGDNAYRVLSGLVDAAVQLQDPVAVGAGATAQTLKARTMFAAAREAAEASAKRPTETMADLRALASTFGVHGRGSMSREGLIQTIGQHLDEVDDMRLPQLRGLAAAFNVPRRTRMATEELRTVVRDRLANVGRPPVPPALEPGEVIEATGRGEAVIRGVLEGVTAPARLTGIPWLARKTGLIKGDFTNGVHGPTADAYMLGSEGTRVRNRMAEVKSVLEMDRLTNHQLMPSELAALVDTNTADEVTDVLRPMLGRGRFRSTKDVWNEWDPEQFPVLPRPRNVIVEKMDRSGWDQSVPGTEIDLEDPRSALTNMVAVMRNAHMKADVVEGFANRLVRARNNNEVFAIVEDVLNDVDGILAQHRIGPQTRKRLTDAWRQETAEAQTWFLDELTEQSHLLDEIDVGGEAKPLGRPHDWSSAYNRYIFLPDFRETRRITSEIPNVLWDAEGELRAPLATIQWLQDEIWKPITLLRAAWPVRVIGEEQFRMAAAGYASMFKDPLSFIAFAVSRRKDVQGDLLALAREYQEAQVRRTAGWLNDRPGRVRTGREVVYGKGDEGWDTAVAARIAELHMDPVTRKIAQSDSLDEVEEWLMNGEGREWLDKALLDHPERFPDALPSGGVRQYIENASAWIDELTGGNDDLLRVVRTGKVRSARAIKGRYVEWDAVAGDLGPSQHLKDLVGKRAFDAAPERVIGHGDMAGRQYRGIVTERMFSWLMGKPTNYLSRSPVFTQAYWERLAELTGFMSPTAKAELLEGATRKTEGLLKVTEAPADVIRKIKNTEAVGSLSLTEADVVAKGYGLDRTRRLLYDMSERSQVMDSLRLVFPFGEAWREVITRWAGELANPFTPQGWKTLRRYQQIREGLRGEDLGELMGAPEGKGFFFKDEYGEDVFIYPFSGAISQAVTDAVGEPLPTLLAGRVEGLSMFGQVIPGIGPAASIPVAWLIQDEPGWQRTVRNWLLPYGHPSERGGGATTQLLNYAPPWMRHAATAVAGGGYDQESNRIFANSVMSAANYYYSTGKYDTSTDAGRKRLLEDAREGAKSLAFVRFLAAFGAPAAPSLKFLTETDEGTQLTAFLRDDYYRLVEEEGYEVADELFLERWGETAGMVMQAQTREVQPGIEPTQEFADWARSGEAQHLQTEYDAIWAFFGPDGGEFDTKTYVEQIRRGERETLTPKEWLALGQNHLGQMLQDYLMSKYPENPTEADRQLRYEIEQDIADQYPGFNRFDGLEARPERETIMSQIDEAMKDKRVLQSDLGEPLELYWRARNDILRYAEGQGLTVRDATYDLGRARSLSDAREWLYGIGEDLAVQYPVFSRIWTRQLRHEVAPDEGS